VPTKTAEYVSQIGMGDETVCNAKMNELAVAIRKLNEGGRAVNFSLGVLHSPEEAEDELVDTPHLHQFTAGVYPVFWMNLTYDPTRLSADQLASWEQQFALRILSSSSMTADIVGLGTGPGA
jgi:hypothetical protein